MSIKRERVFRELFVERISQENRKPRIEPTRKAAELLGDPQLSFRTIHITGTNGKTSTSRITESLIRAHGLRTGLFTSPHLIRINERIVIDGEPISDDKLESNWDDIQGVLKIVDDELREQNQAILTYFEALTILALASFADAPIDVAVFEVGVGGLWDSTNIIDSDVAVFTPISLDHTDKLGKTVEKIAQTKSGIIKAGSTVISALQEPEALAKLEGRANELAVPFLVQGRDFAINSIVPGVGGQLVEISGLAGQYQPNFLPLLGDHQAQNAAVAVAAVEALIGAGEVKLSDQIIEEGLQNASSPGRLELISTEPTVLVDAAHNPGGALVLVKALDDYFSFKKLIGVMSVLADKDSEGIFEVLKDTFDEVIITESHSSRVTESIELAEIARKYIDPAKITVIPELDEALKEAIARAKGSEEAGVLVTGSITLIGEATAMIRDWSDNS